MRSFKNLESALNVLIHFGYERRSAFKFSVWHWFSKLKRHRSDASESWLESISWNSKKVIFNSILENWCLLSYLSFFAWFKHICMVIVCRVQPYSTFEQLSSSWGRSLIDLRLSAIDVIKFFCNFEIVLDCKWPNRTSKLVWNS